MVEQTVREITHADIEPLTNYWMNASDDHLTGMGVDLNKMPSRQDFEQMLREQIAQPIEQKKILLHHLARRWPTCGAFQYQ